MAVAWGWFTWLGCHAASSLVMAWGPAPPWRCRGRQPPRRRRASWATGCGSTCSHFRYRGMGSWWPSPVGKNRYAFTQRQIRRRLHPHLPPAPLWAYDDVSGLAGQAGSFGMAVVAHSGTPVRASFTNELPIPVGTRLTVKPDRLVR